MARFYLTTAIDYVNARPHLGTAYEKITADVIARYKRLCGVRTRFLMGNDEHSQNVFRKAREAGLEPLAYCDRMEREFRDVWDRLDISYDDFIRTTEPRHRAGVTEFVKRNAAAGDIYDGYYEGWYCVSCESFKQEKDLVEGKCPIHLRTPEWIREKNYFFRLSRYQEPLRRHFDAHPEFLEPDIRRNEILRLLESGLEDISMSRAGQAWGVPLPFDPASVVYVWYDALINYISALGFPDDATYGEWWPADLHVIGKDITRFHCVVWPAMLMSAGLALPRQVFGHGWMHYKGQKMSKSLGTMVDPIEAAERFGVDPLRLFLVKESAYGGDPDFSWERLEERYNVDLANNLGNLVSRLAAMVDRYQQGRLRPTRSTAGRLAALAETTVQDYRAAMDRFALHEGVACGYRLIDGANEFITETEPWAIARDPAQRDRLNDVLYEAVETLRIGALLLLPVMPRSCAEILARLGDRRIVADWRLDDARWMTDRDRAIIKGDALWPRSEGRGHAADAASLASASFTTTAIRKVDVTDSNETRTAGGDAGATATAGTEAGGAMKSAETGATASIGTEAAATAPTAVAPASPPVDQPPLTVAPASLPLDQPPLTVGPASLPAVPTPTPAASAAEPADKISIDEFLKVDLRVARITAAERVPKSKKLVKLSVDLGYEERTLVAGIGDAYEPETLVGRHVAIVANLKPAKLMGIESNGMVLAAGPEGGLPILVTFDPPPPLGSRVR